MSLFREQGLLDTVEILLTKWVRKIFTHRCYTDEEGLELSTSRDGD